MEWGVVLKFTGVVVAMLDPIGNLPVYLKETAGDDPRVRRTVSLLLATALCIALVAVFMGGMTLLQFFGVSLDSFRIAGGLLLLLYGLARVQDRDRRHECRASDGPGIGSRFRALLVPICIPIYVGPGTISTVIVYSQTAESNWMRGAMIAALLAAGVIVGLTFLFSGLVKRVLGETGLSVAGRLMGLVLAAVGVELLVKGLSGALPGLIGKV